MHFRFEPATYGFLEKYLTKTWGKPEDEYIHIKSDPMQTLLNKYDLYDNMTKCCGE
jgi:hypothetical protein